MRNPIMSLSTATQFGVKVYGDGKTSQERDIQINESRKWRKSTLLTAIEGSLNRKGFGSGSKVFCDVNSIILLSMSAKNDYFITKKTILEQMKVYYDQSSNEVKGEVENFLNGL